uniref:Uncharacterized protein n=1 Tax=Candidatus Kentrum sp. LFY TaxID=2126342 RepID=A0A450UWL3_9GAMM|nr:MAG: hypothetical protein BECKLFY1418A_GA0070994_106421 [Candidatus Kentron sp. LFY]
MSRLEIRIWIQVDVLTNLWNFVSGVNHRYEARTINFSAQAVRFQPWSRTAFSISKVGFRMWIFWPDDSLLSA